MIIAAAMTKGMTLAKGMAIDMIVVTMIATTVVIAIGMTGTTDTSRIFQKRGRG